MYRSLHGGSFLLSLHSGPYTYNSRFHHAETNWSDDTFAGTNYVLPDDQKRVLSMQNCATSMFYCKNDEYSQTLSNNHWFSLERWQYIINMHVLMHSIHYIAPVEAKVQITPWQIIFAVAPQRTIYVKHAISSCRNNLKWRHFRRNQICSTWWPTACDFIAQLCDKCVLQQNDDYSQTSSTADLRKIAYSIFWWSKLFFSILYGHGALHDKISQ